MPKGCVRVADGLTQSLPAAKVAVGGDSVAESRVQKGHCGENDGSPEAQGLGASS
jgi:hypothetical protein